MDTSARDSFSRPNPVWDEFETLFTDLYHRYYRRSWRMQTTDDVDGQIDMVREVAIMIWGVERTVETLERTGRDLGRHHAQIEFDRLARMQEREKAG